MVKAQLFGKRMIIFALWQGGGCVNLWLRIIVLGVIAVTQVSVFGSIRLDHVLMVS